MFDYQRIKYLGIAAATLPCALLLAWVSWENYPIHVIYVYDAEFARPLTNVYILSEFDPPIDEASVGKNAARSNNRGRLELRLPRDQTKYRLKITFQGYEETTEPQNAEIPSDCQTMIWMHRVRTSN